MQNDHYNIRSKGDPPTLGEMQEKLRLLMRKVDPLAAPKKKTQNKSRKIAANKSTSMRNKLQNTLSNNTNIHPTSNASVSLPPLDYNNFDYMKKTRANISLFELDKIHSHRDILLCALG